MSIGVKLCIPPLSEVCAIVGSREQDKTETTREHNIVHDSIQPGVLLSVITSEKVLKDFQDKPDLCTSSCISWSILKNLPTFCFPLGFRISSHIPEIKTEYGIFTDETGSRLYMYCLCFPVKIQITEEGTTTSSMFSIKKLCFFSSHRCFILMKDILQTFSLQLNSGDCIETEVKNLLVILSKVFVPPKGTLDVSFGYKDKIFTLSCPVVAGFGDAPLSLPFMFFDHKAVIEIIVAIMSEQRVVFVSNNPSTRVLIMECFLSCIFPFEWLAPYFPLLTENLYDLLDAMGYFIFGADRSVLEEDHDDRRIIFVDIDNGTVNYCDEATRFNFDPTVEARLKERLPGTSFNFLCSTVNKIFRSDDEFIKAKEEFDFLLNVRIYLSVQYVLIDLYKGLLTFQMSAKKKISIQNQRTECPSYQLTPLQMHLKDTMMRSNLRLKYNNPYLERQCFALLDVLKKKPIDHVLDEVTSKKRCNESITFTSSVDDNLKSVELKLTTSDSLSDKSSLLYLRALLLLNKDEVVLAFQSINKIFEAGVKSFPAIEVMALLKKLEHFPVLYSEVMKQNFMKQAVWAPLTMELGPESIMKSQLSDRKDYNYLEFPELMLEMGITRNHETARQIFNVLKSNADHVLGQDTKNFCEIWGGLRKYLDRRLYLPLITNKEKLVKYSEQDTKTDTGNYLVGSIYKLYFVDIATSQVSDFVNIDEIIDIRVSKPSQIEFQLKSRESKQIDNIKDAARWILILEELISATHIFKKTKDQSTLVDARAEILIFESLHQYESKHGELLDMSTLVEEEGSSSNFFIEEIKHSRFLTYQKQLKMSCSAKRSISTISNVRGMDNVLYKFSPNPKIKETIEVIVSDLHHLYIGTRTCCLHKVSLSSFEVEDHISMMLPDNENWTLYDILLINDDLWMTVKYKSLSRSLHIMECNSFDNYQTLPLFQHHDHIVSMRRVGELCLITSMDGLTSIWSIETKSIQQTVQDCHSLILTAQVIGVNLIQSVKHGFSVFSEGEFVFHNTGFTLSKFVVCEELGHIYGIDKAAPDIIRCFSSYSFFHLEALDICNTIDTVDHKSFYNLVLHGDENLVLATRNCSLLVYNLTNKRFERKISDAHTDLISCMITTDDDRIITGSRSLDGTVTVWIDMFD